MKKFDVVIIGAGSIGLPLSYYLASKGISVAVIEQHASPGRGQNRAAIGGIRATHSDPAKIKIGQMSLEIIRTMKQEHGIEVDWYQGGYLFPVFDPEHERALKKLLEIQHGFGLNINWIDEDMVEELAPGIATFGLRGGTYSPEDGYASPLRIAGAFYKLAKEAGVSFFFYETVLSVDMDGERVITLNTDKDRYEAGLFINASGGNARKIGKLVNADIPVYPDSHEAGITEPVARFMTPMIVDIRPESRSHNYYFYQTVDGQIVFCITPHPAYPGKDIDNTSEFLPLVVRRMLQLYPRLRNIRVRRTWRGLYPMTRDGFPIVDYAREATNMLHMVGMCGQGLMLGPGLGKIVAEKIADNNDEYDFVFEQFSLYRDFSGDEMLK